MVVIESQYFPPLEYFSLIKDQRKILIDVHEHFIKQTYRNRCYILTSNKVLPLSVPLNGVNKKNKTGEIKINYSENWMKDHWGAITSAYGKSPFFEFYEGYIHQAIHAKHERLIQLNNEILSFCLKVLQIDVKIAHTEKYVESTDKGFEDYRSVIHPKIGHIHRKIHDPKPYTQIFGSNFASNLSILDLIFCCGPESRNYI